MGVLDMKCKTVRFIFVAILVVAISGLISCGEDQSSVSQPQPVKKKIDGQPEKADSTAANDQKKAGTDKTPASSNKEKSASKLVAESRTVAGAYDAKGRFDPFTVLFKGENEKQNVIPKGKKRRIPQTPLERVAISQLKLSAIMRSTKGNSAIVEDGTGKGYVIRKGTYIGLNSGQVIKIDKGAVMIEEEIEDVSGEFRIKNIELKLQKPAGEL